MRSHEKSDIKKNVSITTIALIISILCMLLGSLLAEGAVTAFGDVRVVETEWVNENGADMYGVLYIPTNASEDNPSPAVVISHGFSSNNMAMEQHGIELARRGIVSMCIDAYGHGRTGFPDTDVKKLNNDMGLYSALQYVARLPYVDAERLGATGHSMGGDNSRFTAIRSYIEKQSDPSVALPKAIFIQSNAFKTNEDGKDVVAHLGVNYGVLYSTMDEFTGMMWRVPIGSDYTQTEQFAAGVGFEGAQVGKYYNFGDATPLSREEAIAAGDAGTLRVGYSMVSTHSAVTFSNRAVAIVLEYFDLALNDGQMLNKMPYSNQVWRWKTVGGGLALIGFAMFIVAFGLTLLKAPFFKTLVKPEGPSLTTFKTGKDKIIYAIIFVVAMLAPTFTYTWASGLRLHNLFHGVVVPVNLTANNYFNLTTVNGIVLMNLVLGAFYIALFTLIYLLISKKKGGSLSSTGLRVKAGELGKSILLAVTIFAVAYITLAVFNYFLHIEFGFFKFEMKVIPSSKWFEFLKYLPFFFIYFIINSVMLNAVTRINSKKEWVNMLLCIVANTGGLLLLYIFDYGTLFISGSRGIPTVPGTTDPNSLSGILMWGLLFILPLAAVIGRVFYKKTGRAWVGATLNGLLVTFFSIAPACRAMLEQLPEVANNVLF